MITANHLAFRELWRNRGRFLLFSLVIALITVLVLFIAALGEGLGAGNREYLEKLDADLIVYQEAARLSIAASRIERDTLRSIRNIEGVKAAGPIGFASAAIPIEEGRELFDISLIGVEPKLPGNPPIIEGQSLFRRTGDQIVIDETVAMITKAQVGDWLTLRSIQGSNIEFHELEVVGICESRKYSIRPSVFAPYVTWARIRPKALVGGGEDDLSCHIVALQLEDPVQSETVRELLRTKIGDLEAVDHVTAYENTPGYAEQQSTLATQNTFALLIGILVIGGFFQIQTLQKVGQIGMLKAIGTPNRTIAVAIILQILTITLLGVLIGSLATWALSLSFPPNIPIVFEWRSGIMAIATIIAIGPLGGLVSIRYALSVEPLVALGLSS